METKTKAEKTREYQKKYYELNRAKVNAYQKEYQKKARAKKKAEKLGKVEDGQS